VNPYVVPALVLVVLGTVGIGAYGLRFARTTSDFLVASRSVTPSWNAAAISGEYLSAASFLGVAGLILRYGVDVLWYPVGFAAGYSGTAAVRGRPAAPVRCRSRCRTSARSGCARSAFAGSPPSS
jgi:Na+(H+)/acetate symporter ActP